MRAAERSLGFACAAMKGQVLPGGPDVGAGVFVGAATDSRMVQPGRLFFGLPGERVDGFDFCGAAAQAGAAAVVVAAGRGRPAGCENLPVIAVADARLALGDLARAVRGQFGGRVVGVTGSNGKTTTKELIAAALAPAGSVLRTQGNFNTDVGLPLTVLDSTGDEAFWVLEMAMRGRGEIDYLARLAQPHVGVVTNVAAAHLGRLGSLEEVARAKGEIFHCLGSDGVAVLPADEPLLAPDVSHLPESRLRRFGPAAAGSRGVHVRILEFVPAGVAGSVIRLSVGMQPVVARVPLAGEHNARNVAAALAVASALGVPILRAVEGLRSTALPPHRSRVLAAGGRTVLDDCYNANPASMSAALRALMTSAGASGRGFAILGDMLELGPEAEELHAGVGREAAALGLAGLVGVGPLAQHIVRGAADLPPDRVLGAADAEQAAARVAGWSAPGDWILVKGSRGMRLERAVDALLTHLGLATTGQDSG